MDDLTRADDLLVTQTRTIGRRIATTLRGPVGLSHHGQITLPSGDCMIAVYDYHDDDRSDLAYVTVDPQGEVVSVLVENEGVLPYLFLAPTGDPWVTLELPTTGRSRQRTVPLAGRIDFPLPEPQKSFGGEIVGVVGHRVLWHDVDPSGSARNDRWWVIAFDDRGPSRPSRITVPAPSGNSRPLITSSGTLVAATFDDDRWQLREFTPDGSVIAGVAVSAAADTNDLQPVRVDPRGTSECIAMTETTLERTLIDPSGRAEREVLATFDDELLTLWPPCLLSDGGYVVRFTRETGHGWLVVRDGRTVELVAHDGTGFTDRMSGDAIELAVDTPIIEDASPAPAGGYRLSLTPPADDPQGPMVLLTTPAA